MILDKPPEFLFSPSKLIFSSQKVYVSPLDIAFKSILVIFISFKGMISFESLDVTSILNICPFHFQEVLISGIPNLLIDLLLFSQNSVVYSFYHISIPELIPVSSDLWVVWADLLQLNRL